MIKFDEVIKHTNQQGLVIVRHGYTDYMRDYEIISANYDGIYQRGYNLHQFVGCVSASVTTQVPADIYKRSLPDEFVRAGPRHPNEIEPEGFIWGVRFSTSLCGIEVMDDEEVGRWRNLLKLPLHKALVRTEVFDLELIFSELRFAVLPKNYSPMQSEPIDESSALSEGLQSTIAGNGPT
jgi:hypothetical protein